MVRRALGGQRARIALARAILTSNRSDVFLLDDPFAAVDGSTGEHMFRKGVVEALKGKLRVVVMNSHMELLKHFDKVLMIDGGRVIGYDSPDNILASGLKDVFLSMTGLFVDEDAHELLQTEDDGEPEGEEGAEGGRFSLPMGKSARLSRQLKSSRSVVKTESAGDVSAREAKKDKPERLAETGGEISSVGDLSAAVYIKYFGSCLWPENVVNIETIEDAPKSLDPQKTKSWKELSCSDYVQGGLIIFSVFVIFFAAQAMRVFCDLFLIQWAQESSGSDKNWMLFYRYLIALGLLLFLNLLRMGYLNTVVTIGTRHIHHRILQCVMAAPVPAFFDTHAIGEVGLLATCLIAWRVCSTSSLCFAVALGS